MARPDGPRPPARRLVRTLALATALVSVVGLLSVAPPDAAAHTATGSVPTATTAPPTAVRKETVDRRIDSLRRQVAEASREEAALLDRVDDAAARREAAAARLRDLDAQLAAATEELAAAEARLAEVDRRAQRAATEQAKVEAELEQAQTSLTERAIEAYVRRPPAQALVLAATAAANRELVDSRELLEAVVEAEQRTVSRFRQLKARNDAIAASLAAARHQAEAHRSIVELHREKVAGSRQAQDQARAEADRAARAHQEVLVGVRADIRRFEAEIAALKRESDAIGSILRRRPQAGAARAGTGALQRPVPGPITSGFGPRRHPIFGTVRNHTGIDFSAPTGTPIRAAAAGVVVLAEMRGGYGLTVVVEHGNGLATLYAHQSRLAAWEGAVVGAGQVVGYAGSTGFSTGPHLHFEVRVNGTPVDPRRYL